MTKVGITGASGFIGGHLVSHLKSNGIETSAISLRKSIEIPRNDLQAVIHLAAKSQDKNKNVSWDDYKINIDLLKPVFDQFLDSDIRDFIFFSSIKSICDFADIPLDEKFIPEPQSLYGKSKLEAEKFILSRDIPQDKRVFIVRPSAIYAPGTTDNISMLFKLVQKGVPWPFASFENKRSFLNIDNLNYSILEILLNKDIESGIYHIADDEALSTNEMIILISKILDRKPKLWKISPRFIKAIGSVGNYIPLPINTQTLDKLTKSYVVSNSKLKKALGIINMPFSIEDGLRKTIENL